MITSYCFPFLHSQAAAAQEKKQKKKAKKRKKKLTQVKPVITQDNSDKTPLLANLAFSSTLTQQMVSGFVYGLVNFCLSTLRIST